MPETAQQAKIAIPFDAAHLDRLMEEAGIDVLLATSKHNVHMWMAPAGKGFLA